MTSNLKSGIGKFGDFDTYFMPTYELIDNNIGGTIYSWGYNSYGQIGDNTIAPRSTPTQISSNYYWKKSSPGYMGAYFLTHNGELYSSGYNGIGALGLNYPSANSVSNPTQISGTWVDMEGPRALKADGTLWAWGENLYGQLGDNTRIYRSSPVQVIHPNGSKWSKIGTENEGLGRTTFCIDEYGYLWGWGSNSAGELGNNTIVSCSTPVQVGTDQWRSVSSGGAVSSAGIKIDGTLWTWGFDSRGQLGLGLPYPSYRSTPTQVGTDNTWKQVTMSALGCFAIKNDGTLWAIGGQNDYGGLGLNDTIRRSTPTQVGSGSDWKQVSSAFGLVDLSGAVKTDGTLWMWGSDSSVGRLGLNTFGAQRSTPTQVTLPNNVIWKNVSLTTYSSVATSAGQGPAGAPTYHVSHTQSSASCYSAQGGFSLDIMNGSPVLTIGVWPSDPPNCQYCYGVWLAFSAQGLYKPNGDDSSNNYRAINGIRPFWAMTATSYNLDQIALGATRYVQIPYWPYTLVGYTYAITRASRNSVTIQTYPTSWGTGDTGSSISIYNWWANMQSLWGGVNGGKAGWTLGTGTFTW